MFSVGPKPELIDLELFGEPIIQTQTAKLLGILFDRRLSFKDHMKDLMTKVYRRLNLLKSLKGTDWGARPYTILKAYKCFIRPVLEYGSLITGALRESQVKEDDGTGEAWCSKWRIKLNAGKTQLIVFSVGPKPELIDLELFGEPIIQTQTAKLLVILFDRRLSFKDHMKDLMTKVYRRLNLLKLLKGTNWGARPYTILKAYKCFIRPVLEYGSLITGALRESQVKEDDGTGGWTFRSLENTQCFKDLVLNHEIVQKRSGSNTILDQLLAAIQADA